MKREIFAAGVLGLVGLLAAVGYARGEDLVTLSGTTYHDVRVLRVEPDGVTWRHADGAVKVDFADCPENIRRAYHYDPARATAYRQTQAEARQQADEQARRDTTEHASRQQARMQAAMAQAASQDGGTATVFRRALSPAASNATREMAARMQADADKRAAEAAANPDQLNLIPPLPGALGPRPINPFMDTPNSKEFAASLHSSLAASNGNFLPTTDFQDPAKSSLNNAFFQPLYMTRSYYEEVDRATAFARGVPPK